MAAKAFKPVMLFLITVVFGNVLIWIEDSLTDLRSPYTNVTTTGYTTMIILYRVSMEFMRMSNKRFRMNKPVVCFLRGGLKNMEISNKSA